MKFFAISLIIYFISPHLLAQNTPPPEMPIPPEFSQQAPPTNQPPDMPPLNTNPPPPGFPQPQPQPQNGQMPQQQMPTQMQHESMPPSQMPPPQPQPAELNASPTPKSRLPDDFELIEIRPYFKNKARLGKLTATLTSSQNDVLASVSADFGDCKNCIRGASLKGKLGIRLYGNTLKDLIVSRKQSSSIKLVNCSNKVAFVSPYICEFASKDATMKFILRIDP